MDTHCRGDKFYRINLGESLNKQKKDINTNNHQEKRSEARVATIYSIKCPFYRRNYTCKETRERPKLRKKQLTVSRGTNYWTYKAFKEAIESMLKDLKKKKV